MKIKFTFLLALLNIAFVYSQRNFIDIRPKALDIGVYDAKKVVKNTYKIFHGEEAEKEFNNLLERDENIRKKWIVELLDSDGNIYSIREVEISIYYPDLEIVITTGGHGHINVEDINKEKALCSDPMTYAYSPSRKYRFSGLEDDGMRYYLEEKIDGEYVCLDLIFYGDKVSGFYWNDDETIYYLREREKYDSNSSTYSKCWMAYSTKFYSIKNDRTH